MFICFVNLQYVPFVLLNNDPIQCLQKCVTSIQTIDRQVKVGTTLTYRGSHSIHSEINSGLGTNDMCVRMKNILYEVL